MTIDIIGRTLETVRSVRRGHHGTPPPHQPRGADLVAKDSHWKEEQSSLANLSCCRWLSRAGQELLGHCTVKP